MSEEIGKHKGAVKTLLHEKKELSRLLQIVNSQLQKHLGALEEAGIDTEQFIQEVQQGSGQQQQEKQEQHRQQRNRSGKNRQRTDNSDKQEETGEDKKDADELLEGENDFSDRDFSPR